jgi:hypothetical protein
VGNIWFVSNMAIKENKMGLNKKGQESCCAESISRQSYWSEIEADEKANRCREYIKRLENRISQLETAIFALVDHEHSDFNGKVTVTFDKIPGGYCGIGHSTGARTLGDPDESYF